MTGNTMQSSFRTGPKEFTILMAFLMSIIAISIDALLPALGVIRGDLGLTEPNQAQYLIGGIFIGMALGELVAGPLSDAVGRRPVLHGGILLYLAGSVLCYVADSLPLLLAGRFIQGLGVAGPHVSTLSIVRDRFSGREMARVMSLVMMVFITVPAIAPTLGQGVMLLGSWRDIFLMYIAYAVVIMLWMLLRLEETLPPSRRIPLSLANLRHGFREVVTNRVTISYTFGMGLIFGSFIGYLNSSQQIFQVQFNTGQLFTVYFGALALVFGFASLVNARLVERLGMARLCYYAFACMLTATALFLALHYVMPVTLSMFLIYAVFLFFSIGLMFGNLNALAMEPMGHIAGMASAIIGFISSLCSTTLGTVIGQYYDNTLIPILYGFLVLGGLALLLMLYAEKWRKIRMSGQSPA